MSSDDKIDVSRPLREMIEMLGFEYHDVTEMTWTPDLVRLTVLKRDAEDAAYLLDKKVAVEEHDVAIQT